MEPASRFRSATLPQQELRQPQQGRVAQRAEMPLCAARGADGRRSRSAMRWPVPGRPVPPGVGQARASARVKLLNPDEPGPVANAVGHFREAAGTRKRTHW